MHNLCIHQSIHAYFHTYIHTYIGRGGWACTAYERGHPAAAAFCEALVRHRFIRTTHSCYCMYVCMYAAGILSTS
jgi:hypothetical protein